MTTFAEAQRWLRQKKASGRLSPTEEQQAYQAYFSTEAGQLDDRARIEQQAQRDAVAKSQGAERLSQSNRVVMMQEQREKDKADAAEIQGRLQTLKMTAPNLFLSGSEGGGAQAETQGVIGSKAVSSLDGDQEPSRAVSSLDIAPASQEAQDVQSQTESAQETGVFNGKTFANVIGKDTLHILGIDNTDTITANVVHAAMSKSPQGYLLGVAARFAATFVTRSAQLIESVFNWGDNELGTVVGGVSGSALGSAPNGVDPGGYGGGWSSADYAGVAAVAAAEAPAGGAAAAAAAAAGGAGAPAAEAPTGGAESY